MTAYVYVSLKKTVLDPQGKTIWETTLHQTEVGNRILSTPRTGSYKLVVEGQSTGGSFNIRWV